MPNPAIRSGIARYQFRPVVIAADQDLTITDGVGLNLLKARRIKQCWSTDRHLRLTGATLVLD
jgi:hypothetical protein